MKKHKIKRKKPRSAAQKAATRKMLAANKRAKAPSRRKKAPRRRAKSLLSREGKHRPVVIVRKRRLVRPKRSTIPKLASFKNPFLGELAMIGNPHRKRRKSRKSHRKARRHSRRGLRLNPSGALSAVLSTPRELVKADFLKDGASVAAGFVLPNMIVASLPAALHDTRLKVYASKLVVVGGLSAVASMVSKRAAKMVLLGGGISIGVDLWLDWVAPLLGRAAPAPAGTGVYYGQSDSGMSDSEDGVGVYYGQSVGSLSESFG